MNTEIEKLLNSGREKLDAIKREIDEKEAAEHEYLAELNEQTHNGIVNLVPNALRQYVSIENNDFLHIQLPDSALLAARVYLEHDYREGKPYFHKAELSTWKRQMAGIGGIWRLFRYGAHEGEVSWYEEAGELYEDLEVALTRAVELGDGKAEADIQAEQQRAKYASAKALLSKKVKDPAKFREYICPLMSKTDERVACLKDQCALFMETDDRTWCSIALLADISTHLATIASSADGE